MIELKTSKGEKIDVLSQDITIELNNSLFNDSAQMKGNFSYPINLALSPNNIKLFGFSNQLEVSPKINEIPVRIKAGSKTFKSGMLKIAVQNGSFLGTLKLDLGMLNERMATTKITDIPFDVSSHLSFSSKEMAASNMALRVLMYPLVPYTFIPTSNPFFKGDGAKHFLVNPMVKHGNSMMFRIDDVTTKNSEQIVPYFSLIYVLSGIANFLDLELDGDDFILHPDVQRITIYNINALSYKVSKKTNAIEISANNHLPELTIAEFLKNICTYFCCAIKIDFQERKLNMSWKKSTFINPKYTDWQSKMIEVSSQIFPNKQAGYHISGQVPESEPKDEVIYRDGIKKEHSSAGTLLFVYEKIPNSNDFWLIPSDTQNGNITNEIFEDLPAYQKKGSKLKTFPLRFFFAGGRDNLHAPVCSNVGSDFDLQISGEKGLFNFAHRPWLEKIHDNKIIKAKFLLSENDLHHLDDRNIIQIKSENGVTVPCLLKKLTFTSSTSTARVVAEAEMSVLTDFDAPIAPKTAAQGLFSSTIYVRMTMENERIEQRSQHESFKYADLTIELFQDQACNYRRKAYGLTVYYIKKKNETFRPIIAGQMPPQGRFPIYPLTENQESCRFEGTHTFTLTNVYLARIHIAMFTNVLTERTYSDSYRLAPSPAYIIV